MRLLRFRTIPFLLLLGWFFFSHLQTGGYRLPRYYTPDGAILGIQDTTDREKSAREFLNIAGMDPAVAPAIFAGPGPVIVTTDRGTGIMRKVSGSLFRILYDFRYSLLSCIIFLVLSVWFIEYGRDFHLASLGIVFASIHYFSYTVLAYHEFQLIWLILSFAAIPALINMGLRTTGKEITSSMMLMELLLLITLFFIAYIGHERAETFRNLMILIRWLIGITAMIVVFIQMENALKKTNDSIESLKRWSLVIGSTLGIVLPGILLITGFPLGPGSDPLLYPFILSLIFPLSLLYGTYRIHITPFQFLATRSLIGAILTLLLITIYGLVLLLHGFLIPTQEEQNKWIVNLTFLLFLVFFLDPIRKGITRVFERRIYRMDPVLASSLDHLARLSAAPASFNGAVRQFTEEIQKTLNVEKIILLFSEETFPDARFKNINILRIPRSSTFWRHIPPDRITVTSYLTYGSGSRGELYRFLMRNRIYLAVGVTGSPGIEGFLSRIGYELSRTFGLERRRDIQYFMNSAILVGFRRDRSKFRLSETRYLQEAARLGAMILDNYILLLQELEKRRNERQLFLAGRIQKKLTDTIDEGIHGLQVSLLVHPVASVTGDYVDVIELEGGRSGVFLGDVSGHGLGTGYLVSAIRSIIRSHLETGHSLLNTVATVHSFLAERYNGREFLTLFAAIIDPEKGIMEYINAGHPGPILQAPRSGEIRRIPSHVSVLGVIDMELETKQISLRPEQRLFLYSDGVTESFNEKDEPFGMEALEEFIGVSGQIPLETLPILVAERLRSHRGKAPISDDISFIAIQFTPDRVGSVSSYFGLPEESPVDGSDTER